MTRSPISSARRAVYRPVAPHPGPLTHALQRLRMGAVLGLSVMALAACGDKDGRDEVTATAPPVAGPTQSPAPARGRVLNTRAIATVPREAARLLVDSLPYPALSGDPRCDVQASAIAYETPGPNGEPGVQASALLLMPAGAECSAPAPLVSYGHGTQGRRAFSMTDLNGSTESRLLLLMYAAQGYPVVATDYLGYGESNFAVHPYLHADSEASATIDAIRAARNVLIAAGAGARLDGRVMLSGYSQGGHAAMATQRTIERDLAGEIDVVAGGHMSGPYDLFRTFNLHLDALPAGLRLGSALTALLFGTHQRIWGDVNGTLPELFKPPFQATAGSLFPGTLDLDEAYAQGLLPLNLAELITDKLAADLRRPDSAASRPALDNSLLQWTPRAPVLLCGGARDPVVPWVNSQVAGQAFAAAGSRVTLVDLETDPEFASLLPPILTSEALDAYHALLAPLCMKVVRDRLLAPIGGVRG